MLEIEGAATERFLFRQHGPFERDLDPNIAEHEFLLLQELHSKGLPVPQPFLLDDSGEIFPAPYLVAEFIEGETEFKPVDRKAHLHAFAEILARIHRVEVDLSFLPDLGIQAEQRLHRLDDRLIEGMGVNRTLIDDWPPKPANRKVLLHGDLWSGNILWRDGHLAGVIDWEDAGIGDPLLDISTTRLELFWAFGEEAMDEFLSACRSLMEIDFSNLPYWDIHAALRAANNVGDWGLSVEKETEMRDKARRLVGLSNLKIQSIGSIQG